MKTMLKSIKKASSTPVPSVMFKRGDRSFFPGASAAIQKSDELPEEKVQKDAASPEEEENKQPA
jgi:hypothetical protein